MPDTQTDLVIQISTSQAAPSAPSPSVEDTEKNKLIAEIRQCFRPGAEIVLILGGCTAITSILWLSELQQDGCFRAGIRLLGVSALPAEQREARPLGTRHREGPFPYIRTRRLSASSRSSIQGERVLKRGEPKSRLTFSLGNYRPDPFVTTTRVPARIPASIRLLRFLESHPDNRRVRADAP